MNLGWAQLCAGREGSACMAEGPSKAPRPYAVGLNALLFREPTILSCNTCHFRRLKEAPTGIINF